MSPSSGETSMAYMDGTIQHRQSALITAQVLSAECNGLSQFKEDTGKPSMPVQKFNLISCPIAPFRPGFESSACQPSRHSGL